MTKLFNCWVLSCVQASVEMETLFLMSARASLVPKIPAEARVDPAALVEEVLRRV